MNQNDFRALLAQPSKRATDAPTNGATSEGAAKAKHKFKPRSQRKEKKEEDDAAAVVYRDRAAERRKAVTDDTEEQMLKAIDFERSKFLGGDLAHTHLVKGLDFALLSKIRADIEEQEAEEREAAEAAKSGAPAKTKAATSATSFGAAVLMAVASADRVYRASAAGGVRGAPRLTAAYVAQVRTKNPFA
jgi:hypothetical protein